MLSFTAIGIPVSGMDSPRAIRSSAAFASARALSSHTSRYAWISPSFSRIAARYAFVSSSAEYSFASSARRASAMVNLERSIIRSRYDLSYEAYCLFFRDTTCFTRIRLSFCAGAAFNKRSVYSPLSCGLSSARITLRSRGDSGSPEPCAEADCIFSTNAKIPGISVLSLAVSSSETSRRASLASAVISTSVIAHNSTRNAAKTEDRLDTRNRVSPLSAPSGGHIQQLQCIDGRIPQAPVELQRQHPFRRSRKLSRRP